MIATKTTLKLSDGTEVSLEETDAEDCDPVTLSINSPTAANLVTVATCISDLRELLRRHTEGVSA